MPRADLARYRARCAFFLGLQRDVPATLRQADRILTPSEATARDLQLLTGVARTKIRVVPHGVPPGFARAQDRELIARTLARLGVDGRFVLYVGSLEPNKDLPTLIGAFARASQAFRRQHQLVIAGPRNWFQPVLEEQVAQLGIHDRVRFPGFVPDDALPVLYSAATVTVCPSPLEGFGFPVLESMACGTPVIVADAGALPEVAGEAALRVPANGPDALADAMERLAGDARMASELAERGLSRCREFSWGRTARLTLDVYAEAAA